MCLGVRVQQVRRNPAMELPRIVLHSLFSFTLIILILPSMRCDGNLKSSSSSLHDIWQRIENDIIRAGGIDAEVLNTSLSQKRHFLDPEGSSGDYNVRLLDYFRRRNRDGECNPETNIYPCGALDFLGCTGNKKFYAESVIRLNWFEAWEFCRNNGMHLASVESTYEQVFLELFLPKPESGSTEGYWLSGTDFGREGLFYWMNSGKSFTYTNWNPSEPNNYNGREHCVQMIANRKSTDALRWYDAQCNKVGYVVCQEPYDRRPASTNAFDWVQERDNSNRNKIIEQLQGKTNLKPFPAAEINDAPMPIVEPATSLTKETAEGHERPKNKIKSGYSPILSALAEAAE